MVDFTKVHGNGNDFIVLENMDGRRSSDELARFARLLCRRNFSIGADGILVMERCADADFVMRIFNADGSEGEMCGNGARAIARYAFEKGLAGSPMRFMTLAGPVDAVVEPPFAELDMGNITLKDAVFGKTISSHGMEFPFVFLTVGVPHCVLLTDDYDALSGELKFDIGRDVSRNLALFPNGSNVTFAQPVSPVDIAAVTYERGVEDLTKSCGTGCVATAIALSPDGLGKPGNDSLSCAVSVRNPGGVNEVRLNFSPDRSGCHAWLKGRTAIVAEGRAFDEAMTEGKY